MRTGTRVKLVKRSEAEFPGWHEMLDQYLGKTLTVAWGTDNPGTGDVVTIEEFRGVVNVAWLEEADG